MGEGRKKKTVSSFLLAFYLSLYFQAWALVHLTAYLLHQARPSLAFARISLGKDADTSKVDLDFPPPDLLVELYEEISAVS